VLKVVRWIGGLKHGRTDPACEADAVKKLVDLATQALSLL